MNGLFSALSGAKVQELYLSKVTNNLANVNTAGYKGDYPSFESFFASKGGGITIGKTASSSVSIVKLNEGIDIAQGSIKPTGNPLDLAIEGDGFFVVNTPQGQRYSRNGNFSLDSKGLLVTNGGFPLVGESGNISITGNDVVINDDGTVIVDGKSAGKLRLVLIDDKDNLLKEGSNLFSLKRASTMTEPQDYKIIQGSLEMSNVNTIREMTRLITISRSYGAYQKMMQSIDDISGKTINKIGRTE